MLNNINNPAFTTLYNITLDELKNNYKGKKLDLYTKIIKEAFTQETLECKGALVEGREDEQQDPRPFLVRIKKPKESGNAISTGRIFVIRLYKKEFIDEGSVSEVYKVDEVVKKQQLALKTLIPTENGYSQKHLQAVRKAKQMLKTLNPSGNTPGIVEKPLALIGLSNPKDGSAPSGRLEWVGSLEALYESDLYDRLNIFQQNPDLVNNTKPERRAICRQLLEALVTLHEKKFTHGDIKIDNILIKGQEESVIAHLSDFGGAKTEAELPKKESSRQFTAMYNLRADLEDEDLIRMRKDWQTLHELKTKRDIFEAGVTITTLFTLNYPFVQDEDEYIDNSTTHYRKFVKQNWDRAQSKKMIQLLNLMLHDDPFRRPTAQEALQLFNEIP